MYYFWKVRYAADNNAEGAEAAITKWETCIKNFTLYSKKVKIITLNLLK